MRTIGDRKGREVELAVDALYVNHQAYQLNDTTFSGQYHLFFSFSPKHPRAIHIETRDARFTPNPTVFLHNCPPAAFPRAMRNHYLLGIHVDDIDRHALPVQSILTAHHSGIATRLGLHHKPDEDRNGVILLEVHDEITHNTLRSQLNEIEGVTCKEMVFGHVSGLKRKEPAVDE